MTTTTTISSIFNCSLERAFKTPMLCDITKVHTGFGFTPRVTHCEDDADWGKPGSSKKVFVAKNMVQPGGWASMDRVIERKENDFWIIEVGDFKAWMLSFTKFVGTWKTTELAPDKVLVEYSYTMHSSNPLLYPFCWLFTKTFWRVYMKRVLENIRRMAYNNEPYLYP